MLHKQSFVDEAVIFARAGDGGRGCVSFRRTKNNPRGGPNGGNGGNGGDVYIEADASLHTLIDYLYPRHLSAGNGCHGQGSEKTGAKGKDLIISVPPGVIISDKDTKKVLGELVLPGQRIRICCGGRGGKGNQSFTTSTRQAPAFSQSGEKGEEKNLSLELRLLADAGLIGLPNAGKSTLLHALTSATPKIADYPFTTLSPKLGELRFGYKKIILAEIPGLIEGSSHGRGLGNRFLRHLSRTTALIHLIDMSGAERMPWEEYSMLRREMASYKKELLDKKTLLVASKMDLSGARENLIQFKKKVKTKIIPISAKEGEGLEKIRERLKVIFKK